MIMLTVQIQVQVLIADTEREALLYLPKGRKGGADACLASGKCGLIGSGEPNGGCPTDFRLQAQPTGFVGLNDTLSGLLALAIVVGSFQGGFQIPIVETFGDDASNLIILGTIPMLQGGKHELFSLIVGMRQIIPSGIEVTEHQCPEEFLDGSFVFGIEHIALALDISYFFFHPYQGTIVGVIGRGIKRFRTFRLIMEADRCLDAPSGREVMTEIQPGIEMHPAFLLNRMTFPSDTRGSSDAEIILFPTESRLSIKLKSMRLEVLHRGQSSVEAGSRLDAETVSLAEVIEVVVRIGLMKVDVLLRVPELQ